MSEGSVFQRADGRWCAKYKDVTGKWRYIYRQSKGEAKKALRAALKDRDDGVVYNAENLAAGMYLDRWLDSIRDTMSERTWLRHEQLVRLHIKPAIGSTKLARLTPLQVQSIYSDKLKSGVSPTCVRKTHSTLFKALKQAVRWRLVPTNVCQDISLPKVQSREVFALTREQVHDLLETAKNDPLYALYVLAISTGMRQAECLALAWDCVDFDSGTVQVKRTVWKGKVYPPKTTSSRRKIQLPQMTVRALWEHRQRQAPETVWCFPSRSGKPMDCHNFIHRKWKRLLRDAGLPSSTRFHDLRSTHATALLMQGVNPKVVSQRLGHTDVAFTLRVYQAVLPAMQDEAVRTMDQLLNGSDQTRHLRAL